MLVAHQHATVADDRIHAAAIGGVDEVRDEVVVRGESGLAKVDEAEVGQVAFGDAACVEAEDVGTGSRGGVKDGVARDGLGVAPPRLAEQ